MKFWTDYPILALGDEPGKPAPIRECEVLSYDGDKYVDVLVGGIKADFKAGYLYPRAQRCGEGPAVSLRVLEQYEVQP